MRGVWSRLGPPKKAESDCALSHGRGVMEFGHDHAFDRPQPFIVAIKGDPVLAGGLPRLELDLSKFHSGRWALQLDAAFARRSEPAVIVAEGVACLAVAWWAQLSPRSYLQNIGGALFLSPLNIRFGQAAIAASARLSPGTRLPFPTVVASDASSFVEQVLALADSWGSRFVATDSPAGPHPTNLRGVGTAAEDRLLELLDFFDGQKTPPASQIEPAILHGAVA